MKKAFTLIELLAVISILAILSLVIIPSVDFTIKKNKEKLQTVQYNKIEEGLKSFVSENIFNLNNNNFTIKVSYIQLVELGFLEYELKDPTKKDSYYNPYTLLTIIQDNGKISYDIPLFIDSVTLEQLNNLPYCTLTNAITKYNNAIVTCDNVVQDITPTSEIFDNFTIYKYTYNGYSLYQNVME